MMFKLVFIFLVVSVGFVVAESSNGDGCILRSGEIGVCTSYKDCEYAREQSCSGILRKPCRSYAEDNSVCCTSEEECPPMPAELVSVPLTGYKAWDYCVSLAELAYPCKSLDDSWTRGNSCPQPPNRDVMEAPVQTGEYPHLVLLSKGEVPDEINWSTVSVAAGTLISDRWVLSSGLAAIGRNYAKIGGITDGGDIYEIKEIILHPDYVQSFYYDSIGLIELKSSVTFSKNVMPACLHTGSVLPEEKLKEVSRTASSPYNYNSWDVSIIPHEECFKVLSGSSAVLPGGVKEYTQFCTERANNDVKSYLNGAPVQVYNGASVACTQTVLGVFVQFNQLSLFTRVSAYIPWIESLVWPSDIQP